MMMKSHLNQTITKNFNIMECPHRPKTVAESHYFECTCPKECPRHGKCCACVAHHRAMGKLPHCLRSIETETKEVKA